MLANSVPITTFIHRALKSPAPWDIFELLFHRYMYERTYMDVELYSPGTGTLYVKSSAYNDLIGHMHVLIDYFLFWSGILARSHWLFFILEHHTCMFSLTIFYFGVAYLHVLIDYFLFWSTIHARSH